MTYIPEEPYHPGARPCIVPGCPEPAREGRGRLTCETHHILLQGQVDAFSTEVWLEPVEVTT